MILVIQGSLPHYRVGFFNALCAIDDVVVVHSGAPTASSDELFVEMTLPAKQVGPFFVQEGLLELIERLKPDAVIAMFDLRWIMTICAMYRFDRTLGWVWWGLGDGASKLAKRIKVRVAQRPNPIVFYSKRSMDFFLDKIPDHGRLFMARNTLLVPNRSKSYQHRAKDIFVNVGSLDARKRNDVTIKVMKEMIEEGLNVPKLILVGDGAERVRLAQLASDLQMQYHVEFVGFSDDPQLIRSYYERAIASVSPGQAGLAVLQSLAHGVPFVTCRNAISSGESENIIDGKTGLLCDDSPEDLGRALRTLMARPEFALKMGEGAYKHFTETATLENMVARFEEAITCAQA